MVVLLNDPRLLSQVHFVLQEECAHFFCHLLLDILTVTSLRVFLEVGDYLDLLLNWVQNTLQFLEILDVVTNQGNVFGDEHVVSLEVDGDIWQEWVPHIVCTDILIDGFLVVLSKPLHDF